MRTILLMLLVLAAVNGGAQELYPSTEPASAMSAKSIGLRINNQLFPSYNAPVNPEGIRNKTSYRLNPEVMWGINKKWMVHLNFYASNIHSNNFRFEGNSVYLKYRIFSSDQVQSHFRIAIYGKASLIDNPVEFTEINLAGDNSGIGTGIITTQLLHKVAISFTGGYLRSFNNLHNQIPDSYGRKGINYSLSTGYLFLPFHYTSYKQINMNLYAELLGKTNPESGESFLDIAPSFQFIINSIVRLDFVYQKQLYGNMLRINNTTFALRMEYNLFNAY